MAHIPVTAALLIDGGVQVLHQLVQSRVECRKIVAHNTDRRKRNADVGEHERHGRDEVLLNNRIRFVSHVVKFFQRDERSRIQGNCILTWDFSDMGRASTGSCAPERCERAMERHVHYHIRIRRRKVNDQAIPNIEMLATVMSHS